MQRFLAGMGLAVKDSIFEGFGRGPASRTAGREVTIEPGEVGGQVTLTGPHLMDASSQELCKAHEGVRGQGGGVGITWGWRGQSGPMA